MTKRSAFFLIAIIAAALVLMAGFFLTPAAGAQSLDYYGGGNGLCAYEDLKSVVTVGITGGFYDPQQDEWGVIEIHHTDSLSLVLRAPYLVMIAKGTVKTNNVEVVPAEMPQLWQFLFARITPSQGGGGTYMAILRCEDGRVRVKNFGSSYQFVFWLADHMEIDRL